MFVLGFPGEEEEGIDLQEQININDNIMAVIYPYTIGNFLSPDSTSPFISGKVVRRETAEKQSIYGNMYVNIERSRIINSICN